MTPQDWQAEFNLADRKLTDSGESRYFILIPGYQMVLEARNMRMTITVLEETRMINGISTRVVEEREEASGTLHEISRNFFAMDETTGDAFYFGEEVDYYDRNTGRITHHSGAWMAYENDHKPALMMPGNPQVGMKYYQENAPEVAMDRAEVISVSEKFTTPAGKFENCLIVEETSALKLHERETKTYAPGIGLVQDESLRLVSYGYTGGTPP